MSHKVWLAVAGAALLGAGGPLLAHHAFSAEFDANAPVTLRGPVTRIEWINPHAWIHMEAKLPDGKTEVWMVEGGTPNTLQRNGITRDTISVGTVIVVSGYQAKDGRKRANGRDITFPTAARCSWARPAPAHRATARIRTRNRSRKDQGARRCDAS
jgi:hypothetical protein